MPKSGGIGGFQFGTPSGTFNFSQNSSEEPAKNSFPPSSTPQNTDTDKEKTKSSSPDSPKAVINTEQKLDPPLRAAPFDFGGTSSFTTDKKSDTIKVEDSQTKSDTKPEQTSTSLFNFSGGNFTFGNSTTNDNDKNDKKEKQTTQSETSNSSNFLNNSSGSFNFGATSTFSTANNSNAQQSTGFPFGGTGTTTGFKFGASPTPNSSATSEDSSPKFNKNTQGFNTQTSFPSSLSSNEKKEHKPINTDVPITFNMGPSTNSGNNNSNQSSAFGNNNSTFNFGSNPTNTSSSSTFGNFGTSNPASNSSNISTNSTSNFNFGSQNNAFGGNQNNGGFAFGANNNPPFGAPVDSNPFGSNNNINNNSNTFSFGSTNNVDFAAGNIMSSSGSSGNRSSVGKKSTKRKKYDIE